MSKHDIVKNSYYEFDGNEDEKTIEIICEFFLKRKCSKESFDYLLSIENFRMIGSCYLYGRGTEKDYEKAFEIFRKASDLGNLGSLKSVGICYYHGKGVEQDYEKAFEFFIKAVDLGYTSAIVDIGTCYFLGRGAEQDYKKAYEYFKKASKLKDAKALLEIGNCYYYKANYEKAYKSYKKASELGNMEATVYIGDCYYYGKGVEQDYKKAYEAYNKTVELEDVNLLYPWGCPWLNHSENPNYDSNIQKLKTLQKHMKMYLHYRRFVKYVNSRDFIEWIYAPERIGGRLSKRSIETLFQEI